jgi:multiple sugar transport system substrate-binding protein
MLVGAKQLGVTIFDVENGTMKLNFDEETVRKLWDNYYVPFVKGYFAAEGRFRSDDIKTGTIISCVGSTSSATFFPNKVSTSVSELSMSVTMMRLPDFTTDVHSSVSVRRFLPNQKG